MSTRPLSTALLGFAACLLPAIVAAADELPPVPAQPTGYDIAAGPFEPSDESFAKNYKCPEWFRDAKLGIWAHWGPQSVPMMGDWYARRLYLGPGAIDRKTGKPLAKPDKDYLFHIENYGHPSVFGYKDIIPLWKAEKWDPEHLMELYKKAGAKYFVSMGVHHDNFDLWNSKYHRWNAVNMGPKRDVVGTWQAAAKKNGLRFGVSEHLGASFTWFQAARGADGTGPKAGVPYDGNDPKWEDLYHFAADAGDTGWYSTNPRWHQEWFNRIKDLVDNYQPDLLYTDGGIPFANDVGMKLVTHYYNASAAGNGGVAQVVYNCKQTSGGKWIDDLERGVMPGIRPYPWQTDTSIGDWFYNRNWKYRGADWVIQMLVDIVSKNGNLLINVVQRPDGSLDPEPLKILDEMASWMAINGEAIYGTRPWVTYGEGLVRAKGGHFKEDFKYTAKDIRFTTKGDATLYAMVMGWPEDGKVVIRSLAKNADAAGKIQDIALLGSGEKLKWAQDGEALTVTLPANKPCDYVVTLKITGENLFGFKPDVAQQAPAIFPEPTGNYTLSAEDAEIHGELLKTETRGGQSNLGRWDKAAEFVTWKVDFKQPKSFKVVASIATPHNGATLVLEGSGQTLEAKPAPSGSWDKFADVELGTLEVKQAGEQVIKLRPRDAESWKAINVRWVKLVKTN